MRNIAAHNLHINCKISIEQILSFEMSVEKDTHAAMQARVLSGGNMSEEIIEEFCGTTIEAEITDDNGVTTRIFAGHIDNLKIDYEGELEIVTISALSSTILLDIKKKSRSFQDTSREYFYVIHRVLDDTEDANSIIQVQDKLIKKPVIQYEETDWQFIKRLASHLGTSVIPDIREASPRVTIGLRDGEDIGEIEWIKYKTVFDARYYTDAAALDMPKQYFVYYDLESYSMYSIGDIARFLGQSMSICALKYTLRHDTLHCEYRLAHPDYFKVRQQYNESMRGLSLPGTVLKTDGEFLRVHLDIDAAQDADTAYDYTWRPETGNLMYLVPEIGTKATLYIQNEDEFSAICKNSDRTNGAQMPEAQKPEDRYLTTAHSKRMYIKPEEAGFISINANSSLKIDDAIGTIINSSGSLLIQADNDVKVNGSNVLLRAPKEVTVVRRNTVNPTVLNTCHNFDIVGNIGGFFTTKPPGELISIDSQLNPIENSGIEEFSNMIVAAVPSDLPSKSTPLSGAIQGKTLA